METIQLPPEQNNESVQQAYPKSSHSCCGRRRRRGCFFVWAFLFGIAGGIVAPFVQPMIEHSVPKRWFEKITPSKQQAMLESRVNVVAEDNLVADLVEKNSPGVVSIVITKDVPKVRQFFNSPFGGGFPFFFDPFSQQGIDDQGQERGATEKQQIGSGSGFFVSADGLIVTNKHVVSDEQAEYTVIVDGGTEYNAKVLARDPRNDIALLKIEGNAFPALTLGNSDAIKVGQTAIAIGNPLGEFANSVSRGIISGLKRSLSAGSTFGDTERLTNIIQTDAAINPGNSGGPLFNVSGEVIGVNVAMAQGAENIGFALPINQVKRVVEQVERLGRISTPYLGLRYILLNDELQKKNNLPFHYGALVLRGQNITDFAVIPGSPADKAGIMENDIILEIDGTKIDEAHPLGDIIGERSVEDEVTLKVWHRGNIKDIQVKLEERE